MTRRRAMAGALALALLAGASLPACAGPQVATRPTRSGGAVITWRGDADAVAVRGTWTGWAATPLTRVDGGFELEVALPPGRYEYRLEVLRGAMVEVVLPPEVERVDDGFGGENAVLRVP